MTNLWTEAQARITGYVNGAAENERIATLLRDLNAAGWDAELRKADAEFLWAIENSHDLAEIRAAHDAREALQQGGHAYNEIRERLQRLRADRNEEARNINPEDTEPAFAYLHDRLGQLVARVRELDRTVQGVQNINQALRGDDTVLQAWRDLEDAADEYEAIRAAQTAVFRMVPESYRPDITELATIGHLTNAFEHEAYWVGWRRNDRQKAGRYDTAYLEWLHDPAPTKWTRVENSVYPGDERVPYLRWLAQTGRPWVPTIAQLNSASIDIKAMLTPLSDTNRIHGAIDAYDRYYDARGVKAARPLDTVTIRAKLPAYVGKRNRGTDGRPHADPRIIALIGE